MLRPGREKEEIMSAGIDIGTSTTKLILSRFSLANTAGTSHVPRIEIIDKQVIYKSPIYRTPLRTIERIDMDAVLSIVQTEYAKAGVHRDDIQTGAVIITGETATKENAEEMVHSLADKAGEFLVATAGPDLEGIIAAKGSGAYEHSRQTGRAVANIDIGGGTANIAVYQAGTFRGTCTLHIGGRLIEYRNSRVEKISPPIQKLIKQKQIPISPGDMVSRDSISEITDAMAETLAHILSGKIEPEDEVLLLGHKPDWRIPVEDIMFSGGVSECIYGLEEEDSVKEKPGYDDIGLQLAASLRESPALRQWNWIRPLETVRATVLGAGMQTTELSGATIQVDNSCLPVKNLPVYHLPMRGDTADTEKKVIQAVEQAITMYDPAREGRNFALYLSDLPVLKFREVQQLAASLLTAFSRQPEPAHPLIIVVSNDMAKVLGQTLQAMNPGRSIVCIDQILVEHGDYLDIGNMLRSEVVPVVVKTLAFQS
ncbi:ethanolamine ammonia-lyase reactivating factor EutA [Aneurinibacillus tyrosinisolvens]|uniref:ethanolamine ammonia-lyase reactivating factor EutA n=1 Tax=Aneurinibacillus tyrosinisolvens TaxID=1443435 RepID=UPI00063EEA71|nr:ethanolamine ammonia-lyase reactivating factor EutA [Aneurinibacillus tyrosinisolvens]